MTRTRLALGIPLCLVAFPSLALAQAAHYGTATTVKKVKEEAAAGSQAQGGPGEAEEPAGREFGSGGGIYGVERDQGGGPAEPEPSVSSDVPELHTVKKGDTLWGVCQVYFQDPWRWPRLWAENPLITNPHWIFP